MSELQHRLAAILAADAAGYSRLMSIDDRATIATLDAARAVFRAQIEAQRGRVIDTAGDSVLSVFGTALGAVTAALAIQAQLKLLADAVPEDRRMRFRIGVHLGDVAEKADGTVYGDGVNIAARLEGLAEPGGVTVSDSVRIAVKGKVAADFEDHGEQAVKNIAEPVRVWRVRAQEAVSRRDDATAPARSPASNADSTAGLVAADKPSIAVLPFKVLSDDPRLGLLADGLVEDVIALLARVAGFELISQSSSFLFRGRDQGTAAIARELGVRYIVEGSVRPVGGRLRVSPQLVDAASARVLWSGRFEAGAADIADLQDEIARGVMSELEPELVRAEISLVRRLRPENVTAWGHYQQGLGAVALKGWTEEAIREARAQLHAACELDPEFAQARALFSLLTALGCNTGLLPSEPALLDEARQAADQAIALDDGSTAVLGFAGCALSDLGQCERGEEILLRALEIDPSNAQAHVALGATYGQMGRTEQAVDRMRYGMRISPRDRRLGFWGWALGILLLKLGRPDDALYEVRTSTGRDPRLHLSRILEAAVLMALAREPEARAALAAARRIRPSLSPQEVVQTHGRRIASRLEPLWREA
ncbi:MAG: tetratricopeptide repeat protein [Ideonella sp.]|nr:tetratricopeptide repeat protein [Ideonella sp.]